MPKGYEDARGVSYPFDMYGAFCYMCNVSLHLCVSYADCGTLASGA
jgi:hypothetical protein